MKTIAILSFVLVFQGLNAIGQTNAAPRSGHFVPYPNMEGVKAVARLKAGSVSVVAPRVVLSRSREVKPVQLETYRRINRESLLTVPPLKNDPGAALEAIFWPHGEQLNEAPIRDPVVTIFPPGR